MIRYSECVTDQFKVYYSKNRVLFPNCTVPWIQGMLGLDEYEDVNPCSAAEAKTAYLGYFPFIRAAATYNLEGCLRPCKMVKFKLKVEVFDGLSGIPLQQDALENPATGELKMQKGIYFFYGDTNIDVNSQTLILSLNQFISSIGGGLGLFLGFSCINVMFLFIDFAEKKWFCSKTDEQKVAAMNN